MFDPPVTPEPASPAPHATAPPVAFERLATALLARVAGAVEDARRRASEHDADPLDLGATEIDLVTACEEIVRIAQAVQLDAVQALDVRRRAVQEDRVHETILTRSLFTEIALARQVSTPAGETTYALARALEVHPRTHQLLREGAISQAVAAAVCRETTYASPDDRTRIDSRLAPSLTDLSPRRAAQEARRLVLQSDPHAAYERVVRAREERAVSFRPELDAMATLSIYGPAEQLAAAYQRLDDQASARRADGDPRTIRQLTADLAVEALGDITVAVDGTTDARTEIGIIMDPQTLFTADDAPASLAGYGPIPAELARRLAASEHAWVRRFFTTPDASAVTGSDPRARRFSAAVRRLIAVIDGQCRRPWCDCRIRHHDHIHPHAAGGRSTADNAQGTCAGDNLAKEAPGWTVTTGPVTDGTLPAEVHWRTPTGHTHTSRRHDLTVTDPPPPTGPMPPAESVMERQLAALIAA